MGDEIIRRLEVAKALAEAIPQELYEDPTYQLPVSDRNPTFWIIDEGAALHERYKQDFSQPLKDGFWVARSTLNIPIVIGQNPNCSNYGLQVPDAANATRFFLGASMALKGLDEIKPPRDLKSKLRQQIYARLTVVRQKKKEGIDKPPEQYFALVCIQSELPFIAQLPPPNAFSSFSNLAIDSDKNDCKSARPESDTGAIAPPDGAEPDGEPDGSNPARRGDFDDYHPPVQPSDMGEILGQTLASQIRDARKIEQIKMLWASGKTTMREIVPEVFIDEFPGCKTTDSRQYKAACLRYKQLLELIKNERETED